MGAKIVVLAGVNGAGKSSIGGFALESVGCSYFNPDRVTQQLLEADFGLNADQANAAAWEIGRRSLERAIAAGADYAFETTLGGRSITDLLLEGIRAGAEIRMWFCGLDSPERHLQRVASRVQAGGHDIPESKVRERYDASRKNLLRLLPHLAQLDLYDNSIERDPKTGAIPEPVRLLRVVKGQIAWQAPAESTPDWAKPILMAALKLR